MLIKVSGVIFKLLAFTFAMVVFPIGSYFATVNTIFRGKMSIMNLCTVVFTAVFRQLDLRRCYSSCHSECCASRLRYCGHERGSVGTAGGRGEGEEV